MEDFYESNMYTLIALLPHTPARLDALIGWKESSRKQNLNDSDEAKREWFLHY